VVRKKETGYVFCATVRPQRVTGTDFIVTLIPVADKKSVAEEEIRRMVEAQLWIARRS
jgi:hypothetical protein